MGQVGTWKAGEERKGEGREGEAGEDLVSGLERGYVTCISQFPHSSPSFPICNRRYYKD